MAEADEDNIAQYTYPKSANIEKTVVEMKELITKTLPDEFPMSRLDEEYGMLSHPKEECIYNIFGHDMQEFNLDVYGHQEGPNFRDHFFKKEYEHGDDPEDIHSDHNYAYEDIDEDHDLPTFEENDYADDLLGEQGDFETEVDAEMKHTHDDL